MPTPENLASWFAMGAMAKTVPMHSTLIRYDTNWPRIVDEWMMPQVEWGCRRFVLHLPFGKDNLERPMSFDSFPTAVERELHQLTDAFVPSIGRMTNRVEVICYLGSLRLDPTFVSLKDRGKFDDWIRRFAWSVEPLVEADCSICYDTGGTFPTWGPEWHMVGVLKALGVKTYIEGTARPPENALHLESMPWMAIHRHYWNNIADPMHGNMQDNRYGDWKSGWAQACRLGTGMLIVNGHSAPPNPDGSKQTPAEVWHSYMDWAIPMAKHNWRWGFDVCMDLRQVIRAGMTIDELLDVG